MWRKFYADGISEQISHRLADSPEILAVYYDYASDHRGKYSLIIGHKVSSLDQAPTDIGGVLVRDGRYLRFPVEGPMPTALIEAWQSIWRFFDLSHEYERDYATDFEIHRPNEVEIYVGVK